MSARAVALAALALVAGACSARERCLASAAAREPGFQTCSLLGRPLFAPPVDEERRAELEAQLERARAELALRPDSEDAHVWLGRRLAYLGRYREAVAAYDAGLRVHPDGRELLRHRGHRWITLRELDRAIADLERARELGRGLPDEVEPDGDPNPSGVPRSTHHSNVHYHLALARYLAGDLEAAAEVWRDCLGFATNDDMVCSSTNWLVATLRRLGREAEAAAVLAPIHGGMDVVENHAYRDLLFLHRGELAPEEVLGGRDPGSLEGATRAYGVGVWHLVEGRPERARELWEAIVAGEFWPAFGHVAAEAELARL